MKTIYYLFDAGNYRDFAFLGYLFSCYLTIILVTSVFVLIAFIKGYKFKQIFFIFNEDFIFTTMPVLASFMSTGFFLFALLVHNIMKLLNVSIL